MLAEDVWLLVDDIRCQGQHEALTQFILDKDVTYQDGKINQLKLWVKLIFDLEATIISPKYNELEKVVNSPNTNSLRIRCWIIPSLRMRVLKSSVILSTRQMVVK